MIDLQGKNSISVIRLNDELTKEAATPPVIATRKKLIKLEALRGFAALYVVCHHTLPKSTFIFGKEFYLFRYGQEAVILFFVLSGFVIQYAYSTSSDKSFKSFFLKRFLRIFIPLLLVFVVHCAFVAFNFYNYQFSQVDWKNLFGNLLMIQQASEMWRYPVPFSPFLGNLPLWSLSFEWWFYMIFFVASVKLKTRASYYVYAAGMIASLAYLFYPSFAVRELMYLAIWWAGADVAKLYISQQGISIKNMAAPFVALSFITLILAINILLYHQNHPGAELTLVTTPLVEVRHFGFSAVALAVAIVWRKLNWIGFRYTFGPFEVLAPISFCLYISHWFLVSYATYLNNFISNIYLRSAVYFAVCCVFCYLVERIIYPYVNKKVLRFFSVQKKPFAGVA